MISNPKWARIIAVVVIAMLVITLAASLFGCAAEEKSPGKDPASGLTMVERYYTDDHYQSFRRIAADGGTDR